MKTAQIIFAFAIFIFLTGFVSASSNLIDNPGFEDGLDDWAKTHWYAESFSSEIDSTIFHSGSSSVKAEVGDVHPIGHYCNGTAYDVHYAVSGVRTDAIIELDENEEYELSAWARLDEDASIENGYVRMIVKLYKSEEDWNGVTDEGCGTITPGRIITYSDYHTDLEGNEWIRIKYDFETNSENVYAKIWLIAETTDSGDEQATAWFDDVSLRKKESDKKENRLKGSLRGDFLLISQTNCEVDWKCSGWSECSNGFQTRQCNDRNRCEFSYNKPNEIISCDEVQVVDVKDAQTQSNYLLWVLIGIAVLLILIIVIMVSW